MTSICEKLDIPKSFIHRGINEGMSGGERKKCEVMHLWMLEPKLIILDELDSGLDVDSLNVVCDSLNKYIKTHLEFEKLELKDFEKILSIKNMNFYKYIGDKKSKYLDFHRLSLLKLKDFIN